jgi:hypothetical protein
MASCSYGDYKKRENSYLFLGKHDSASFVDRVDCFEVEFAENAHLGFVSLVVVIFCFLDVPCRKIQFGNKFLSQRDICVVGVEFPEVLLPKGETFERFLSA